MAGGRDERWYFTPDVLENSPSRKSAIDADKELSYRQQAANMIQDMGQRLQVTQLCINTAIVYMHRFYVFHSFSKYHRASIAACALFLAAKVEEQPRKLEHVIKIAHLIQHQKSSQLDLPAEAAKLVKNENVMLQTLGFDIAIEHPHTFVVKCCQMVRASKDLAQTCYFMATNSLHLTTMCLKYKPTVVACVCIHLACKWSSWQIPQSSEGKSWWNYVDADVSVEKLEELTKEFLIILDKCPSRLKRKIMSGGGQGSGCDTLPPHSGSDPSNSQSADGKLELDPPPASSRTATPNPNSQSSSSSLPAVKAETVSVPVPSAAAGSEAPSRMSPGRFLPPAAKEKQSYSVYKEKKEQEKREQERKEAERHEADRKRAEAERAEQQRRLEAERRVAAEQQREQERLDRERREQEVQRRELEQREAERRAEAERREKERRAEADRREAEKRDAEKREAERREQERLKAEKVAAERREAERLAEQERREAERREAEVRQREAELQQQEELRRLEEERRRREEAEKQEAARVQQQEDQVKREAEKKNRFFTSRTVVPEPPASFDELIAKTRSDDLPAERGPDDEQVETESPQKQHKSEKSHKRKKSKHHHHHKEKHKDKDKNRDKRHEKQEPDPLPPIKLKIKPLQPEPEPASGSFKIRIPKDLLNHSSASATADPESSSRKRKNSFEAASISKKPVV